MTLQSRLAITVQNLSKVYNLKKNLYSKPLPTNNAIGTFHALNDISFTVNTGEVVGIIGSNGSGKSTLLRILSEITKPTLGSAKIYGSVTSILDIGSNFHPDLTGRENTLMQFRIHEVKKADYNQLLYKICDFSGIGDFFEQPIKYYSNGMFLRLAFSVAFNLLSDILILDEVLSSGDEEFRLKSQDLIRQLKQAGKTILFVSHNRNEILELCDKCIWLHEGKIRKTGHPADVLSSYFEMQRSRFETSQVNPEDVVENNSTKHDGIDLNWNKRTGPGNAIFKLRQLSISNGTNYQKLYANDELVFKIVLEKFETGTTISALILLHDIFNQPVFLANILNNQKNQQYINAFKNDIGLFDITCTIPANFLAPGTYYPTINFGLNATAQTTHTSNDFHLDEDEIFKQALPVFKFTIQKGPETVDLIGNSINCPVRPAFTWLYTKQS